MYEVELKLRADHDDARERLAALDAEELGDVAQADTYYDAPHRDFAETDEALRIRRERRTDAVADGDAAETAKVTYKGPLVENESKTREEFETGVDDGETMSSVFDGLGFEPAAVVEKQREYFRVDEYTVVLDDVAGLGEFVEIEREAKESELEAVRDGAVAVLRELGLDPDEQIRTSYLGLLFEKRE
ncbi:class IV adenylate cyclase [Haloprofundus salinisoli]|uniref:class IV adenylate cyclase n=1 Tax=Haloprofundus salinisoli TaxID=2876193 RepID=UPI001CD02529|nr:class IV adenylate cyclase [Haloprofundus salinisoli]